MSFPYADALEKHNWIDDGTYAYIYHVAPTIAVKSIRPNRSAAEKEQEHPFLKDITFYKSLHKRHDKCQSIVECFLMLPDHLFLSYCENRALGYRFRERQERENDNVSGRLIRVRGYEDSALIARWLQQVTSALEYVEKMGFCHNDLHIDNCLLDESLNLKLADFGRATTIGQLLEYTGAPVARELTAGPLKGTFGRCSARTEQFAVGSLLYFMVYGHDPYEDINVDGEEVERYFAEMKFPELDRNKDFDEIIAGCWYDCFPNMALLAYSVNRIAKDIGSIAEYTPINYARERKTCEALVRKGILGPELALRFQPAWRRYLHAARNMFFERIFIGLPRRLWSWSWSRSCS